MIFYRIISIVAIAAIGFYVESLELGLAYGFLYFGSLLFVLLSFNLMGDRIKLTDSPGKLFIYVLVSLSIVCLLGFLYAYAGTRWTTPEDGEWMFSPMLAGIYMVVRLLLLSVVFYVPTFIVLMFLNSFRY